MKIEIVGDNKKVKNNPKIEQGKFYKVLDNKAGDLTWVNARYKFEEFKGSFTVTV